MAVKQAELILQHMGKKARHGCPITLTPRESRLQVIHCGDAGMGQARLFAEKVWKKPDGVKLEFLGRDVRPKVLFWVSVGGQGSPVSNLILGHLAISFLRGQV